MTTVVVARAGNTVAIAADTPVTFGDTRPAPTAREAAEIGMRAGCEFDKNASRPFHVHTLKLKG